VRTTQDGQSAAAKVTPQRRKLELALMDIRRCLVDPPMEGRAGALRQAALHVDGFVGPTACDPEMIQALIDTARAVRDSPGPGRSVAEARLMQALASIAWTTGRSGMNQGADPSLGFPVRALPGAPFTETTLGSPVQPCADPVARRRQREADPSLEDGASSLQGPHALHQTRLDPPPLAWSSPMIDPMSDVTLLFSARTGDTRNQAFGAGKQDP
jgi:hypothetical protein